MELWAMENDQVILFENARLVLLMKLGYVEFLLNWNSGVCFSNV